MAICTSCRLAIRRTITIRTTSARGLGTTTTTTTTTTNGSPAKTAADMLSKPTWSVRSLLPQPSSTPSEAISSAQLHHLLRLAALPAPSSPAAEASMMATLQSQLGFVRAVQRADTRGVEPLRAIRDETPAARAEAAVGLEDLEAALGREVRVGHYQRPRRVRGSQQQQQQAVRSRAEDWDALSTAGRTAGRFFVVQGGKKTVEGAE